jgi:uncharacterized protein YecT (DUF1311 family)
MVKWITGLAVVLAAAGAWAQSQTELNDQAKDAFLKADKTLSATLTTLKGTLTDEQRIKVEKAQGAWQTYRDACAESEASQYSGGSIWPMVYYSSLEELTKARTARLAAMLPDDAEVPEEPAPEPDPDPAPDMNPVTEAMGAEAVDNAIADVEDKLAGNRALEAYLEETLPLPANLAEALGKQGVEGDLLEWVKADPDRAYDVLTVAAHDEVRAQIKAGRDGFGTEAFIAVAGYLRDQQREDGITSGAVGAIGVELVVKPMGAYKLYEWMRKEGYAKLMKDYVDKTMGA